MKQTVANKQAIEEGLGVMSKSKTIIEKQYKKVKELYEQAKVNYYICSYRHILYYSWLLMYIFY